MFNPASAGSYHHERMEAGMPRVKLFYHIDWSTKHRVPSITDDLRDPLYASIIKKVADLGGYVLALDGWYEHVHLVVRAPVSIALSEFIGQVKGYSSHSVNLLKHISLPCRFRWQAEYSVESISEKDLPRVIRYVESQRAHHSKGNLNRPIDRWIDRDSAET